MLRVEEHAPLLQGALTQLEEVRKSILFVAANEIRDNHSRLLASYCMIADACELIVDVMEGGETNAKNEKSHG